MVSLSTDYSSIHPSFHLYLRVVEEEDGVEARRLGLEHYAGDARGADAASQHMYITVDVVDVGDPQVAVIVGRSVGGALLAS